MEEQDVIADELLVNATWLYENSTDVSHSDELAFFTKIVTYLKEKVKTGYGFIISSFHRDGSSNTVSFLIKLQSGEAYDFINKETPVQAFSCNFCAAFI